MAPSVYAAIGVNAKVSEPAAIVKLSPTATSRATARSSEPRKVPAEVADQNDTCEYVSAVDTFVHAMSAEFVIPPADAAEHVTAFLVVSPAAPEVPDAPGSEI
jgi:hypothetical protein